MTVVTTSETGLTSFLIAHGHHVISSSADPQALAREIRAALMAPLRRSTVQAALPERDGRLEADEWLHAPR
jgi:hypothetical protein